MVGWKLGVALSRLQRWKVMPDLSVPRTQAYVRPGRVNGTPVTRACLFLGQFLGGEK